MIKLFRFIGLISQSIFIQFAHLFGLVAFRQIELRKITGHQHVAKLMATDEALIREAA